METNNQNDIEPKMVDNHSNRNDNNNLSLSPSSSFDLIIREDGTRHQGCDESSGWIWYAGRVLEQQLMERIILPAGRGVENVRFLELGSGTGWLSLRLAIQGAIVAATERPGALPLLTRNILSNKERYDALYAHRDGSHDDEDYDGTKIVKEMNIDVYALDWESGERILPMDATWDYVIGSDLLYLVEFYEPMLNTILRHGAPQVILTWEERKRQEEDQFLVLAKEFGFSFEVLAQVGVNPATNNPIWFLSMTYMKH